MACHLEMRILQMIFLVHPRWPSTFFTCRLPGFLYTDRGITKGRSLGKWITGTVAVRLDGNTINWKDAFLRSLSRIVPFEPFSALGYAPWHDKWTETTVVKKANNEKALQ
jgi:uncharacterized RDD family membrane protein YckC